MLPSFNSILLGSHLCLRLSKINEAPVISNKVVIHNYVWLVSLCEVNDTVGSGMWPDPGSNLIRLVCSKHIIQPMTVTLHPVSSRHWLLLFVSDFQWLLSTKKMKKWINLTSNSMNTCKSGIAFATKIHCHIFCFDL